MRRQRDTLEPDRKREMDHYLSNQLIELGASRGIRSVHTYLPIQSEIDLRPAIRHWLSEGLTVICPKVLPARRLQHLVLTGMDELEKGHFGTRHPAGSEEFVGEPDLIIIPGLAFDRNHNRLGYGSGYYDNFLRNTEHSYKLGICYPFQLLDAIPAGEQDVVLDAVMSFPG